MNPITKSEPGISNDGGGGGGGISAPLLLDLNTVTMDTLELLKMEINKRQQQHIQQQQQQQQMAQMLQQRALARPVVEPSVTITEQPKARGLRFRYKCEGRSAGSIPGDNSTNERKTYPTIQIINFSGPAAIVVASCVTKDKPYQPHPHNLVGQDCKDGVCTIKVKGNNVISFPNIGIQCCKRHDVEDSLKTREKIRVDPFGTGYYNSISNIDLNTVRLCFQVFLPDSNKKFTHIVTPIVSQQIVDKKSIHDLVICRLSRQSGYANGGDEVFLLCEKINKDDIQVRFYQETDDGVSWEAFGDFAAHDVHRQFAVVFRTPAYKNPAIQSPVQVFIQLRRPSDDEVGDPKPFQYIPLDRDPYGIDIKRKRKEVGESSYYNDRIPTSVLQDVKDDPEPSNQDIRQRVKKKAERGLQKKDIKASASATANDPSEIPEIHTYVSYLGGVPIRPMPGSLTNVSATAMTTYNNTSSVFSSTSTLAASSLMTLNEGLTAEGGGQEQVMYTSLGSDGALVLNSGDLVDNRMVLQYFRENPNALVSINSMDSFTLSGLSEQLNLSGAASAMEQVSNDMNVGAQESVVVVEGATEQEGMD